MNEEEARAEAPRAAILSLSKEEVAILVKQSYGYKPELPEMMAWHDVTMKINGLWNDMANSKVEQVDVYASKDMQPDGCAKKQAAGTNSD